MTKNAVIRVRLEQDELDRLDTFCEKFKLSRSMAIRKALEEMIDANLALEMWEKQLEEWEEANDNQDAA